MCSMYWTLVAEIVCPKCKIKQEQEMQTHDFGDIGSCVNYYKIGDKVDELRKVKSGNIAELFSGECSLCKASFVVDAKIKDSQIVKIRARSAVGLPKYAGILTEKEASKMESHISELRKESEARLEKTRKGLSK